MQVTTNAMKYFTLLAFTTLILSTQAFAQFPLGSFQGFLSNNPFSEACNLNSGVIEVRDLGSKTLEMNWEESGMFRSPLSGFCQNVFDATFTPTFENEWNVNFSNFNLIFGRATLENNVLTITGQFSGASFRSFEAKMTMNDAQTSMSYVRIIGMFGGSDLFANGTLYKR